MTKSSTVERYTAHSKRWNQTLDSWLLTSALLYAYELQSFSSHVKHQEPDVEPQLA